MRISDATCYVPGTTDRHEFDGRLNAARLAFVEAQNADDRSGGRCRAAHRAT